MNTQRHFLLFATLATAAAMPSLAQEATPAVGPVGHAAHGPAAAPDFSRVWYHPALPWFEPPASGPGPVTNRSRGPQRPGGATGSQASPPTAEGVSNYDQLVGDYTNPILKPWAADVVRKFGEISLAGITDVFSGYRGKFLQLHLTIEDQGAFTIPWTATITYVPGPELLPEVVCAENRAQYYYNDDADVPTADKPDF